MVVRMEEGYMVEACSGSDSDKKSNLFFSLSFYFLSKLSLPSFSSKIFSS